MGKQRYRGIGSIIIGAAWILMWADGLFAEPLRENVNLPGMDYRNFSLPSPEPRLCEQACNDDPKCMAFTYVKPGIQGREARCWLKSGVPKEVRDPNCVSGVKTADRKMPVAVEKTQAKPLPRATPGQIDKPNNRFGEEKADTPPNLRPQLEQSRIPSADQGRTLNSREERMREPGFKVSSGQLPSKSPADASTLESLPQITDISPKSGTPGSFILITGSGFPSNPEAVLYDPTGEQLGYSPPYNFVMLNIKKSTATTIEAELPIVKPGSSTFVAISGPRQVLIRVRAGDKQQHSNPSPAFTLVPNMVVGVYRGFPFGIEKNGTTVLWDTTNPNATCSVFHLNPSFDICKGTDILFRDLSLPQGLSFEGFEFEITGGYCYDSKKGEFNTMIQNCSHPTNLAEPDQDLKHIKGKTFLRQGSVSWNLSRESGFSYRYTILVRKPEGL